MLHGCSGRIKPAFSVFGLRLFRIFDESVHAYRQWAKNRTLHRFDRVVADGLELRFDTATMAERHVFSSPTRSFFISNQVNYLLLFHHL
jgi:hypothetical protein